jgi:hypothetical protein
MWHDGPVETFLAELSRHLRRDETTRRRVVAAVGDHLRDLVAEGRARGLEEYAAELEAVECFGSARALARGLRGGRGDARAVWAATALLAAGICGALVFAESRSGTAEHGSALAIERALVGCVAGLRAGDRPGTGQVKVAIRVMIDGHTGRVYRCPPGSAIWFTDQPTDTEDQPIERVPKGGVSMAEALHQ